MLRAWTTSLAACGLAATLVGPGCGPPVSARPAPVRGPVAEAAPAAPAASPRVQPAEGAPPSGELLILQGSPSRRELVLLDVAARRRSVLWAGAGAHLAAWSADGAHLAFVAPHDGQPALGVLDTGVLNTGRDAASGNDASGNDASGNDASGNDAGGEVRWLASAPGARRLCWLPDGRSLVFDSDGVVLRVPADGSAAPARLQDGHSPLLSPDGRWLIVQRSGAAEDLHVLHLPSGSFAPLSSAVEFSGLAFAARGDRFYMGRRHGSSRWQILGTTWPELHWTASTEGEADCLPRPSPDGRTLAFARRTAPDERRGEQLVTRNLDTGAERVWPLSGTAAGAAIQDMAFRPDGRALAIGIGPAESEFARELLLLDLHSGTTTTLLDAGTDGLAPGFTWRPSAVPLPPSAPAPRSAAPEPASAEPAAPR